MEANELILGNKVGFYKPLIRELQIGNVAGIMQDDVYIPEFSKTVLLSYNGITGIPLTEEWLLKFGFESQGEVFVGYEQNLIYQYYYCKGFGIALIGDTFRLWINSEDDWYSFPWTELNFVHELQNLYYALTKTELILKS